MRRSKSCRHCSSYIDFGYGCPVFALPGQMLAVLEQAPAECAAQQRVAVGINTPREVLARHASPAPLKGTRSRSSAQAHSLIVHLQVLMY